MTNKIYYDHAATTKQLPQVTKAVNEAIENNWYNVSSGYTPSFDSRKIVTNGQKKAAEFIGADPKCILFTSGATEGNNMVLKGLAKAYEKPHIITTVIEHPAVYETLKEMMKEGLEVSFVPAGSDGRVKAEDIAKEIRSNTVLISVMAANNETGVLQPIAEIGKLAHEKDILFHTDAVQALSHINIDVDSMNIDFLTASAHKMYGPKGIGFLYVRDMKELKPLLYGGGQQYNMRSGTLNNEGIAGYSAAIEYALDNAREDNKRLSEIRDYIEERLLENIEGSKVNGCREERISTTSSISLPYIEAESLIMTLDMKGILISGGSACATGKGEPSRVLTSMGLSYEEAKGSIRISLGLENTMDQAKEAVAIIIESVKYLQAIRL